MCAYVTANFAAVLQSEDYLLIKQWLNPSSQYKAACVPGWFDHKPLMLPSWESTHRLLNNPIVLDISNCMIWQI